MIRYSVQPRDRIFVNAMDFCLLLEIWEKRLGKNIISEYSQNLLNLAKEPATDALKTTSKRLKKQQMQPVI